MNQAFNSFSDKYKNDWQTSGRNNPQQMIIKSADCLEYSKNH